MKTIIFSLILLVFTSISHADSSLTKTKELIRKCESSSPKVCVQMGFRLFTGKNGPNNTETAALLFKKGCEGGVGAGCTYYGFMHFEAEGVRKYKRLSFRKVKQDYSKTLSLAYAEARVYYTKGCDLGHGYGCMLYGIHYEAALGVTQSYYVARTYYKRGCLLEDSSACSTLARMYERGIGVAANAEKAREYWDKSCKYGKKSSCGKNE